MDYEKKYKEALEMAQKLYQDCPNGKNDRIYHTTDLEKMFPELKEESEDERIKKDIIDFVRHSVNRIPAQKFNKYIVWLEKQGEQKLTLPKWKYKKDQTPLLRDSIILNKYGHVAKLSSGAIVSDVWVLDYSELAKLPKEEFEEQGEQKFKVGDWIVSNFNTVCYVESISEKNYHLRLNDGYHEKMSINYVDRNFHLWTIADAKDGDVLAEDTCTFIIKKLNDDLSAEIYCCLFDDGDFELNLNLRFDDTCTYPATKEQRDLLFAKMEEAGYEWDAKNLQLTKILHVKELSDGINIDKQKFAEWSEEDEKVWKELIEEVKDQLDSIPSPDCRDKEDEKALKQLTRWLVWLKSIKDRYTWKPSDEQMNALNCARWNAPFNIEILDSLYNDLKKLKGE